MSGPCPYATLAPAVMTFCETSQCGWVAQPGNAWSSLAFVLVAVGLWRKEAPDFALVSLLVGLGSFAYHATNAYLLEMADLVTMFGLGSLMVAKTIGRARYWTRRIVWLVALSLGGVATIVTWVDIDAGNTLFGVLLVVAVFLEVRAWRKQRHRELRWLLAAGACFGLGYVFWNLDYYRIVCHPDKALLNGHALWHCATAVALGFTARFYERLRRQKGLCNSAGVHCTENYPL